MEQLVNCDMILDIEMIDAIEGGNQEFEIYFTSTTKDKYVLVFKTVWDLRYSIENGYIDRFCRFRENLLPDLIENSIYIVKNSKYTEYFGIQSSGTLPIDDIVDYLICDNIDTTVEVLALEPPQLFKLSY